MKKWGSSCSTRSRINWIRPTPKAICSTQKVKQVHAHNQELCCRADLPERPSQGSKKGSVEDVHRQIQGGSKVLIADNPGILRKRITKSMYQVVH